VSDRIADLDQKLKAAGIPIQGLSGTRDHRCMGQGQET